MKLIILDRDGVINEDSDAFIKSPDEWHLIEGSDIAIAKLKQQGYTVAVASNQSGIGRGMFDEPMLEKIHAKMQRTVQSAGGAIDMIVYCPHGPEQACACRKPKPGLYLQIAQQLHCDLRGVPVIGDSLRDLQAAAAVGANGILVLTGKGAKAMAQGVLADHVSVYQNLLQAVTALVEEGR